MSVDWLLNGEGDSGSAKIGASVHDTNVLNRATRRDLDDELFGRVFDAVQRLYKDERVALPPIDLGRLAFRKYCEIVTATADSAERSAMIKLIVTQLRAELRSARAAPGTGKASA